MRLGKTERARTALAQAKAAGVDLRDRRILILADGKRTRDELLALLGADCAPAIERLVRDEYLASSEPTLAQAANTPQPTTPVASRRSLVAAKMYLIDMLQLQRTPVAAELRLALQRTADPDALVACMVDALTHLLAISTPSYGERVLARVVEVVPDDVVPRFRSATTFEPAIAS